MNVALSSLAALGYNGLYEADLKKLRPVDTHETELELMAETRAYYQIAYKVSTTKHQTTCCAGF